MLAISRPYRRHSRTATGDLATVTQKALRADGWVLTVAVA